jgi:hypothetical protein
MVRYEERRTKRDHEATAWSNELDEFLAVRDPNELLREKCDKLRSKISAVQDETERILSLEDDRGSGGLAAIQDSSRLPLESFETSTKKKGKVAKKKVAKGKAVKKSAKKKEDTEGRRGESEYGSDVDDYSEDEEEDEEEATEIATSGAHHEIDENGIPRKKGGKPMAKPTKKKKGKASGTELIDSSWKK